MVTACPGCGRTTSIFFQELAQKVQDYLKNQMPLWRARYKVVEEMNVAVMGCVVNGPGESKLANVGISLPGSGENRVAQVYVDGEKTVMLKGERIAEDFLRIINNYIIMRYGKIIYKTYVISIMNDSIRFWSSSFMIPFCCPSNVAEVLSQ